MKTLLTPMQIDIYSSLPLLILAAGGVFLLVLDALSRLRLVGREHHKQMPSETSEAYVTSVPGSRFYLMPLSLILLFSALCILVWQWVQLEPSQGETNFVVLFKGMLIIDRFGLFVSGLCIVFAMLSVITLPAFFAGRSELGEAYPLVLFSVVGIMILVLSNDWVAMFLGIETLSLGVYVLTGSFRRSAKSSEAALKYFLSGAFVSAILLYGIALLYGATGSTSIVGPSAGNLALWSLGALLVLGSLFFKVGAVPFHMWAPDTYEGAPSPVTGFMMSAIKAAAFAFLIRFLMTTMHTEPMQSQTRTMIYVLSALTMLIGNLAALRQEDIKRLLSYSSIAHVGYLLFATLLPLQGGKESVAVILYYLVFYGITAIGTMAVVSFVGHGSKTEERSLISQFEGLGKRNPGIAFLMTLLLLSLAGFPPTAGFLAKFYLLKASLPHTTLWPLMFLALFTSLISIVYYLRIVTAMYFRKGNVDDVDTVFSRRKVAFVLVIVLSTLITIFMGIAPNWFFQIAFSATIGNG